ncbi:MAG: HIT domain-containing protein [Bacteroidetes bacterium]|jgi:histidine triad (HIT) family protein|nr:HIT domain-containing protein [Bacteroidota bacterium]
MSSIFTKIINGEIPAHKLAENDSYLAFLDIRPLAKGHALVVPKQEIDYLFDLSDEQLSGLMAFAKRVAKGLEATVSCKRVGVMVVGTEVPHAHVHLVPFQKEAQIDITRKPIEMTQEEMAALAEQIRPNITT